MKTQKIYYIDQYEREFDAEVCECTPGKNSFMVALDRTGLVHFKKAQSAPCSANDN